MTGPRQTPTATTEPRFAVGDQVIYHGSDETMWGEAGTVVNLKTVTGFGLRCMVRLTGGDLFDAAERSFSTGTPADTVARARRVLDHQASSQDALRGALRLLLAHVEHRDARFDQATASIRNGGQS